MKVGEATEGSPTTQGHHLKVDASHQGASGSVIPHQGAGTTGLHRELRKQPFDPAIQDNVLHERYLQSGENGDA